MSTGSAVPSLIGALAANDLSPKSLVLVLGTARSICHGPNIETEKSSDLHTLLTCLDNIKCESTSTLRSWAAGIGDLI